MKGCAPLRHSAYSASRDRPTRPVNRPLIPLLETEAWDYLERREGFLPVSTRKAWFRVDSRGAGSDICRSAVLQVTWFGELGRGS